MEIIVFLKEYGPAILAFFAAILSAIFSILGFIARYLWKVHNKRLTGIEESLARVQKSMALAEKNLNERTNAFEMSVQGLRAEMHLSSQKFDTIRVSLMGCEANINAQQKTITEHIRELAKIDSKLEAVFRFIEAKARATDVAAGK